MNAHINKYTSSKVGCKNIISVIRTFTYVLITDTLLKRKIEVFHKLCSYNRYLYVK